MEIEGKPARRFRIFQANSLGDPVGDFIAEYDNEVQVLAHERRADWHYLIYERAELKVRIWTCPICKQIVVRREASNPVLPADYRETCKLADYMIGTECVAFRDLKTARRLLADTE
jgi:hypothetical protein